MASLTDDSVTLEMMGNPINLQKLVLDDISKRLSSDLVIVDPNQVSMLLIEMASNLTANLAKSSERSISSWLAKRATSSSDLYKHMSDYDYVGMFSSPASAEISLYLDKNYISNKAIDYNDNYKLVVIPAETVFRIGNLDFGIFYPINIRINKHTKFVTVVWDTTEENPLYTLNTNILASMDYNYMGFEFLQITVPVHQFSRTRVSHSLVGGTGFASTINYTDKFYAARFFTNKVGATSITDLVELHSELGKDTYDPAKPTVRMQLQLENNAISINIPQIYFTSNMVGANLYTDIYTTKGDITPAIKKLDNTELKWNFNITPTSSKYAKILTSIPTFFYTIISDKASGGTDGVTFEELRSRVVNNSFHTTALITPIDLENYFEDKGFRVVKYKDNLTNLIYFAYRFLRDDDGTIIPSSNIDIQIDENTPNVCSSVKKSGDGTITILPTTLYKYDDSSLSCIPLTDSERNDIAKLSKEDVVSFFNSTDYTKSPFHMRLIPDAKYPYVSSYNLMNPSISNIRFTYENNSITAQMTIGGITIVHMDDGAGGYKIRLLCQQSQDLLNVRESDIVVYFYTYDIDSVAIGTKATFVEYANGVSVYDVDITSNYHINKKHKLAVTSLTSEYSEYVHYVDMEQTYYIAFMVDNQYFEDARTDISQFRGIPSVYHGTHTVMIRQQFTVKLGYALDDVIYNSINLQWAGSKYKTYQADVPLLYTTDVYETDDKGVPVYTVNNGVITFNKLHSVGDTVYSDTGEVVYKHRKGEIIRDANGNPEVVEERIIKYYIQSLVVNAKLYVSDSQISKSYREELPRILESYFSTIRVATDNLLERDRIYFKPLRTLGSAEFEIGDSVSIRLPLDLSLRFKVYLDAEAYSNQELQDNITEQFIQEIENALTSKRISLTDIANTFKGKVSHIESIDVLGINDEIDLQTLVLNDNSVLPSIRQQLYITRDNQINIRKDINIEFVQASSL